jgi:hypothetical protein
MPVLLDTPVWPGSAKSETLWPGTGGSWPGSGQVLDLYGQDTGRIDTMDTRVHSVFPLLHP